MDARNESLSNSSTCGGNSLSPEDAELKQFYYFYIIPAMLGLSLASFIVSSIVILASPWVRRPLTPTVRLSLSLAVANTLFSIIFSIDLIFMYLKYVESVAVPTCPWLGLIALRFWIILVQVLHLLFVALNHYVGILRPLHYAATFTTTVLKGVLFGLWVLPLIGFFGAFSAVPGQGFRSENCTEKDFLDNGLTFRIVWTSLFFGPTVVIIVAYCHIFYMLKKRETYLVNFEQQIQLRKNMKMVRTTALIVGTFIIGWGPAVLKFLLICQNCVFCRVNMEITIALGASVNVLFSAKVFADTFIYAIRLNDIRSAMGRMYKALRGRPQRRGWRHPTSSSSTRTTISRFSISSPSLRRLTNAVKGIGSSKPAGKLDEVTAMTNEVRLKTLIEEEPSDPLVEIRIAKV